MRHELLVIEDADIHLSILRKIGAQAGFNTTGVNSVEGAATVLRRRSFECVTLDLCLGERSGFEILELLAAQGSTAPILIISGSNDCARDENFRMACSLGLVVYPPVPKPVDLPALRDTLKQIVTQIDARKRLRLGA